MKLDLESNNVCESDLDEIKFTIKHFDRIFTAKPAASATEVTALHHLPSPETEIVEEK